MCIFLSTRISSTVWTLRNPLERYMYASPLYEFSFTLVYLLQHMPDSYSVLVICFREFKES